MIDLPSAHRGNKHPMSMQQTIETKINEALDPVHLEVINESSMHNVPPGSESHFKLIVVSERFVDEKLLTRHRMINAILADELQGRIHALSMHTLTPEEWFERAGKTSDSPPCLGGAKS